MNIKEKLLFLFILVWIVGSFLLANFWNCTVYAIQKVVAFGVVPLLISKLVACFAGVQFFP